MVNKKTQNPPLTVERFVEIMVRLYREACNSPFKGTGIDPMIADSCAIMQKMGFDLGRDEKSVVKMATPKIRKPGNLISDQLGWTIDMFRYQFGYQHNGTEDPLYAQILSIFHRHGLQTNQILP